MSEKQTTTLTISALPGKLLGVYPQKQDGLYFQRIPIFGGAISAQQLLQIAELAIDYTDSTPLHLTTRQDIELHNIAESDLNAVQISLNDIGLPTVGAGGDSVRNITLCPCCEFNPEAFDVRPLAECIKFALRETSLLENMPRKFKISLAGCGNPQSKPYVSDLSFVATSATTVRVIGAGSLGARPETGIVLYESLSIEDVVPLTLAALAFFVNEGDRQNRRKARLRHVRQRFGDEVFCQKLSEYLERQKANNAAAPLPLAKGESGWDHHLILQAVNGDLDAQHALLLARAAAEQNAKLRINLHHGIEIFSREPFILQEPLKALTDLPCIVACPGSTTCKNGLTNCPEVAAQLSEQLKGNEVVQGKVIALSGCPNNCAHSSVADIGLSGQLKTIDGKRQEVYKILVNGGNGNTPDLAKQKQISTSEDLVEEIQKILKGELQ